MNILFGIALAIGVGLFGSHAQFDRGRSYYPVILIVTASYNVLFAICANFPLVALGEIICLSAFVVVAIYGFRKNLWTIVFGLVLHACLDSIHDRLIANPGIPMWWPGFCLTFDVFFAAYLGYRLLQDQKLSAIKGPT